MVELKLWIRRSANGLWLVDKETRPGNMLQKPEIETYSFKDIHELTKWIQDGG